MELQFRQVTSIEPVAEFLTAALKQALEAGKRVLWLVPGGSAIGVAVAISKRLQNADLHNLTVSLTDERYGPVGHDDSNWRQLEAAGFFLPTATQIPVLKGKDMLETTTDFAARLKALLELSDYKLGLFGIGPDGHTAGILPNSLAVAAKELAAGYEGGGYRRITMTPEAISQLDEAVVYAVGEAKWPVLDQLENDIDLSTQPPQVLKQVPKLTIFNDHKGEPA